MDRGGRQLLLQERQDGAGLGALAPPRARQDDQGEDAPAEGRCRDDGAAALSRCDHGPQNREEEDSLPPRGGGLPAAEAEEEGEQRQLRRQEGRVVIGQPLEHDEERGHEVEVDACVDRRRD